MKNYLHITYSENRLDYNIIERAQTCTPCESVEPSPCECSAYKYIVSESVYSYYEFTWTDGGNGEPGPDNIPGGQPEGTIFVSGWEDAGCLGSTIQQNFGADNWAGGSCHNPSEPFRVGQAYRSQDYVRVRIVDSCEGIESSGPNSGPGYCTSGITVGSCVPITPEICAQYQQCISALGVDVCLPTEASPEPSPS